MKKTVQQARKAILSQTPVSGICTTASFCLEKKHFTIIENDYDKNLLKPI